MKEAKVKGEVIFTCRVKYEAESYAAASATFADISREIKRVSSRKVLEKRYGCRVIGTTAETTVRW